MSTIVQPTLLDVAPPKKTRRARKPRPQVAADAPTAYVRDVDEHGQRRWTLTFPAPDRMLSVNQRLYWRKRQALTESWRGALVVHAKAAKLPTGLARVRLDFLLRFPDARGDRDALNYYSLVVKPATDGLGPEFRQVIKRGKRAGQTSFQPGYGLVPNDTPEFVDGPHITLGPKVADPKRCPFGQVVLTITELDAASAHEKTRPHEGNRVVYANQHTGHGGAA